MIKNLVFDMGNVLMLFDPKEYLARVCDDPGDCVLLTQEVFRTVEWVRLDRGTITLSDAEAAMAARLPERLRPCVHPLVSQWHHQFPLVEGTAQLALRAKAAGYRLYLLSNAGYNFTEYSGQIPVLAQFDGLFVSAWWGMLKPELEIYRAFCQHFSLVPGECFFVDDLPLNVEGAQRAGMKGSVFTMDVPRLEQEMRAAGIAI